MKKPLPVLLALVLLTGCGSGSAGVIGGADGPTEIMVGETGAVPLPETSIAQSISAPAVVTEGRAPAKEYDLPAEVADMMEWGGRSPVAKLAELPEQDVAIYGVAKEQGTAMLLRWGDSLAEFDWNYGGPQIAGPQLRYWDVDDDGQDEVVLVNHIGSGTGVSVDELHIVEKQEDGALTDYVFPEKLWGEQLTSLLGTEAISGRTFAVLGEELVDITHHLPEGLEPEALRGLGTGSIARFEAGCFDGTDIRFSGSACLDADGFYYCYVADLSADVSYADGVYTLSNFHLDSN